MYRALFFIALFFSAFGTQANEFNDAVKAYRSGQFEVALESFNKLNLESPNNSTLLLNLGLAHYKAGQRGLALGLWRKSLNLKHDQTN